MRFEFGISPETYRFPFGKYKNWNLEVIPDSYLKWVLSEFDPERYGELLENIEKVLDGRFEEILSEEEEEWRDTERHNFYGGW